MSYVDGFVIPIKKENVGAYRKMAEEGKEIWMKHGALQYFECVGDDLDPETGDMGAIVPFPKLAKAKKGETVVFAFVIYKSRKHRDEVNKKVMAEMDEKYKDMKDMPMPFDMKRMTFGGFKTIVEG
ncbi:DUF1428 domain-containing protein [Candidatus Berkelbacteria bacterium]|nr:DUF1428 domain-containing protein [Candidatus Berkelbacteria bacterium]